MEYGLIGEKLGHSFSKTVHNELADYNYELKEIKKQDLDLFLKTKDFKAINVTIPYKEAVIPYLYYIDDNARQIGAVNTIVNKNGKLYGYNTDFLGLKALLERLDVEIENKKVLILGSGGTSKTAKAVVKSMNAREFFIVSRNESCEFITYETALKTHLDADIIINTTPVGMYPDNDSQPIEINAFTNLSAVIDVIYNPLNSALVVKAKENLIKASGGLYMLVSQAAFAVEKFLEKEIPLSETERIYNKILKEKQNIVLIGMPSCGKSTVGKILAKKLNKTFVDSDEEIIKYENMTIPQIFEQFGEEYFRQTESKVIANLSKKQGLVIATGGGAVLNQKNVDLLKQNSVIFFLDRSLENLITTEDRPLSSNKESLEKRYNERYNIYISAADFVINADGTIEENVNLIKEGIDI